MKEEKILLIDMCKEDLHSLEFVKPIEEILRREKKEYFVRKYLEVNEKDFELASRIILSGTSLRDEDYLNYLDKFPFLKEIKKPVLGICAGAQILGLVFGEKLVKCDEIGLQKINFPKEFFGLKGEVDVYSLHGYSFKQLENFEIYAKSENCIQAFKHKKKKIYGVIFHPEVKNKELIVNFLKRGAPRFPLR